MKKTVILFYMLIFISGSCPELFGDIPPETEQFIYSIDAFNGLGYNTANFCIGASGTIYLMANVENFILPLKSLVYFWPLSNSWQLDTENLNEAVAGNLEITGSPVGIKTYSPAAYTYSRQGSEYEDQWQVFLNKAAEIKAEEFNALITAYSKNLEIYQNERFIFEEYTDTLHKAIAKEQEAGRGADKLLKELTALKVPVIPEAPDYYVYPVQNAFVLNLPAGKYTMRFINPEGLIMEGSEKNLVVFDKRRENGIGYEIVPGDKWTYREKSFSPSSVLYVDGTTDLFLKPFFEDEFNDLYYNKLLNNQDTGNPELYKWQEIRQVPGARIEITDDTGTARIIKEKSFVTEQAPGAALGYTITPYDPAGKHKTISPDFKAFHIPVSRDNKYIKIRLQDKNSNYHKLSAREIRVVTGNRLVILQVFLALLPLGVFGLVYVYRSKRFKASEQQEHRTEVY